MENILPISSTDQSAAAASVFGTKEAELPLSTHLDWGPNFIDSLARGALRTEEKLNPCVSIFTHFFRVFAPIFLAGFWQNVA